MENKKDEIRIARDLINDNCIVRVPSTSKELPAMGGNGYYTWQFYLREVLLNPLCLKIIGNDFWSKNEEHFRKTPFQIAGVESAAVPIVVAIIMEAERRNIKVNAFTIRKNRKDYGLRNLIEGRPNSEPVFFIDDLTSPKHTAFWHAVYAIKSHRLNLFSEGYVLVLKKTMNESNIIETSFGSISIQSLFTLSDFDLSLNDYESRERQ